jgi:SAM-dependent methyltransferase
MGEMTQSLLVLGRQPELGIAEADSLFGADKITPLGTQFVLLDARVQDVPFSRIGGSTRVAKLLTYLPYTDWDKVEKYLVEELPKHTCCLPEGKIRLGLSVYNLSVNIRRLNATGLTLKKAVKADGRSVRVVPNKEHELNTAQVLHNQLTGPMGMELLLIRDGERTVLAQTTAVQDIEAYAARDQARPARDARVGMLPPKLAQIIINLSNPSANGLVLDPFCGTGVVLQEALLMGFHTHGADLDPRMVEYTSKNVMDWLGTVHPEIYDLSRGVELGDATNATWTTSKFITDKTGDVIDAQRVPLTFTNIACETYLGRPFSSEPSPEVLAEVMRDVDTIHRKFLQNVARQTKSGFRMCIAVPAWNTRNGFKHLKTLDSLEELGYNRVSFVHTHTRDLIYYRENQVVGRELVTLIRK